MLERGEGPAPEQEGEQLLMSLPDEINIATRALHTTLNRLITSRLPLALPPHTTGPTLYTTGLLHFAHVFLTFESLWADLLRDYSLQDPSNEAPPASAPISPLLSYLLVNPYESPSLFTSTLGAPTPPSSQLLTFLQTARPRGLIRSARLKRDLQYLMHLHPTDLEIVLAKCPGDKVAAFCTHIRKAVHEKPWVLVSYAWCFYMAVFSGGRWIRAQLLEAGPEFWQASKEKDVLSTLCLPECGLSLWHFSGHFDGEDIKVDFKTQLTAAETLLTPDQRVDIIEEAKNIFRLCASLVQELDDMFGAQMVSAHEEVRERKQGAQEKLVPQDKSKNMTCPSYPSGSTGRDVRFLRRSEVTGTLVALACFACIALLKLQSAW